MSLNSKKKRKKARDKTIEDRRMKWCSIENAAAGHRGYYTGSHCPVCQNVRSTK